MYTQQTNEILKMPQQKNASLLFFVVDWPAGPLTGRLWTLSRLCLLPRLCLKKMIKQRNEKRSKRRRNSNPQKYQKMLKFLQEINKKQKATSSYFDAIWAPKTDQNGTRNRPNSAVVCKRKKIYKKTSLKKTTFKSDRSFSRCSVRYIVRFCLAFVFALAGWSCDPVILWSCDPMILWSCDPMMWSVVCSW